MPNLLRTGKPEKIECEICKENDISTLHHHHIVERTEINTDNSYYNLAVICANCHNKVHSNKIKIIGVYPSTQLPLGRTLIYEDENTKPVIQEPYYTPTPKSVKYNAK